MDVDGIRLWEGHGGMALERMWKVLVCPESLECTGPEQMEKESQEDNWFTWKVVVKTSCVWVNELLRHTCVKPHLC